MVEPSPEVIGGYVLVKDGFTHLGIGRTEDAAAADAARRGHGAAPGEEGVACVLVGRRLADAVLDHGMDLNAAMTLAGQTHIPGVPLDIPDADLAAARNGTG